MSHFGRDDRKSRHSRSACRKGRHLYGVAQNIGAGIRRQVCQICGGVTIDLTGADALTEPVIRHTQTIGSLSPES